MRLKNKRLILESPKLSDAKQFVKWLKDPAVHQFTTRRPVTLKAELKGLRSLKKSKDVKSFRIITRERTLIGNAGFFINKFDKIAEFHILIANKKFWDKGCGTEITKLMLNYGFQKLKLHKIFLNVYAYNRRAIKVYLRCGFKIEGRAREEIKWKNKYYDNIRMGILKSEWQKLNKKSHGKTF